MCFVSDEVCGVWARNVRATAPDAIRFDFVVTDSLWGQPGASAKIAAVMVLPREGNAEAPAMPLHDDGPRAPAIATSTPARDDTRLTATK